MTLDEFLRKCLGTALSNTFLVEDACLFVGDIRAAREVAVDILIKAIGNCPESEQEGLYKDIITAIVNKTPFRPIVQEIDAHFPLEKAMIEAEAKAYICKSRELGNVLARDFSFRESPFASPSETPSLVMIEWLMAALTFEERQVLLLLRFPDENHRSTAKALGIEEATVRTHARNAKKKLTERKKKTTWESPNTDVPDWKEFQRIYERYWRPSVRNLAYYLLGDTTGAALIADRVMRRAKQDLKEQETLDRDTVWEGNNDFIGFQRLTFKEIRRFLILFNEKDKAHAQAKQQDVWARRVKERLTPIETQVFLLSTFFYQPNDNGIHEIAESLNDLSDETVKENIQRAVKKMLQRDQRKIE